MNIFIKTSIEKTISLELQNSDTILQVKAKIELNEKIHKARQKLLFEGKELLDDKTLND